MSDTVEKNITHEVTPVESTPAPATPAAAAPAPTATPEDQGVAIPPPGKPLGQQLALELLCRAVHLAQSRGAYKLEEAGLFARAVNEFVVRN